MEQMTREQMIQWHALECQRLVAAKEQECNMRQESEREESAQTISRLAADNDHLRNRCSDLQLQNAMIGSSVAGAVKDFAQKHCNQQGYVSVPLLVSFLQEASGGLVGPDDGPLRRPTAPGPPAPWAEEGSKKRKWGQKHALPRPPAPKRSYDQCGDDGMAMDDRASGAPAVPTFWPRTGMCGAEAAATATAAEAARGGWPAAKRFVPFRP
eukprot:TRINITY_DN4918_c0_g1_i1.p1 TRINITY_DN4918_c0_g1~~TRINITY_DN4918_c0_g1_i1.p1  ORF type:complete len:211 (+),score=78.01 TRINITY_DN4918_c0_g1_i1:107-739(+)